MRRHVSRPTYIIVFNASGRRPYELDTCDQYTIQGDLFSKAILDDTPVPTPLEDAIANMAAIDALFSSARSGSWVRLP